MEDLLVRKVEHFMNLPEEPVDKWSVARPTEAAKRGALLAIEMIAQTELPEPMMVPTLDKGIAFEWNILGRELYLEVNADGSGGYLTVSGSEEKGEDSLAIDDVFFNKTLYWLTRNPKVLALHSVHQLMDLPLGESSPWSPSRPSEAAKDLAIALLLRLPWGELLIPMVSAGGDGTIVIEWREGSRVLFFFIAPDLKIDYFIADKTGEKEDEITNFGVSLCVPVSWFRLSDNL